MLLDRGPKRPEYVGQESLGDVLPGVELPGLLADQQRGPRQRLGARGPRLAAGDFLEHVAGGGAVAVEAAQAVRQL